MRRTPPEVRFWRYVEKVDTVPDGCWIWTGYCDAKGYGQFKADPRKSSVKAHRFSVTLHGGNIPRGFSVDHKCRNTSCVNPDHLEPVTDSENQRRRRHAIQDQLELYAADWEAANEGTTQ